MSQAEGTATPKALRQQQTWPVRQEEMREGERVAGKEAREAGEAAPTLGGALDAMIKSLDFSFSF